MRKKGGDTTRKLSTKERLFGIGKVARITFRASPLAVFVKVLSAVIDSVVPIVTTYFAALTTTALAEAYAGDETAGDRAIVYVIITAAIGVCFIAWRSFTQYIDQFVRYKIDAAISDQLYEQFLVLDFWRYDDKTTADLFDKSKQFAQFFGYVFDRVASVFSALITLIVSMAALTLVSWWLGLILIVAVVPGVIIQFRLSRAKVRHWNQNIETRRMKNFIEWNMLEIKSIAELRLYGLVRYLLNLRRDLRDKDEKQRIEFERKFLGVQLLSDTVEAIAEVVALLYTALQIIAQVLPIGQFLYVQQIVSRALGGARDFVSQLSGIDEEIANLFDYNEFMAMPQATSRPVQLSRQPDAISVQGVSFQYPGNDTEVLRDVSLEIMRGQHVAIVGENGAGKSTLIKLLLGLYEPTSGKVMLDDINLKDVQADSWHEMLGVLQQDFAHYSFATARDNVLLGDVSSSADQARFDAAIDAAEARSFLERLPKGFDSFVNQWMEHNDGTSGVDLSGGQWQRLALARNFYRNSPIVILDEPTSAIDALAEARIFKRLFDETRTIITISHRVTTIEKADVIYMLEQGKVVERGTHKALVAKRGAYYTMFESQLGHQNES